jgi:hypothetical protein
MKRIALSTMLLLALAGCAQSRWDKPNAPSDVAAADMAECRRAAQHEAFRRFDLYPGAPMWGYSSYGDPLWSRSNYERWGSSERLQLQMRFTENCMRQKGYARVPVNPS